MKAWMDGQIVDGHAAVIPVMGHGFLYGDGVFEGIRIAHGRVFRLDDHLRRLADSARLIGLALPMASSELRQATLDTARAFGETEAYVRLIVSRGVGPFGVDPTPCASPRVICLVGSVALYPEERRRLGLRLLTASVRRPSPDALDPRVKSLNYLNNIQAQMQAVRAGVDDALLLNQAGRVAEASVANIFCVRNGGLVTPPLSEGPLGGITRDSVLKIARATGIEAREDPLTRYDLITAAEVFLTGSGAGLASVSEIDGCRIGSGDERPVASRLICGLDEFRRENGVAF